SDKPDLRLPAMVDVKPAFTPEMMQALGIAPGLPIVAIRIPKVGELSRKEREEIKPLFGERKDAKLFDDFKRLEKSWPDAVKKIRGAVAKADPSLLAALAVGAEAPTYPADSARDENDDLLIAFPEHSDKP